MKFLLFNVVVVGALVFLLNGQDRPLQDIISDVLPEKAEREIADIQKPAPAPAKPKPAPTTAPVAAAKIKPVATPPEKPAAPISPAAAKRRAEVLGETAPEKNAPRFMSSSERKQSLLSMAEDLELFSVEAAAQ